MLNNARAACEQGFQGYWLVRVILSLPAPDNQRSTFRIVSLVGLLRSATQRAFLNSPS